jgi:hypothetical protein
MGYCNWRKRRKANRIEASCLFLNDDPEEIEITKSEFDSYVNGRTILKIGEKMVPV